MNTNKRVIYVIINPVSGKGSKKDIPEKISLVDPKLYSVYVFVTGYAGHASEIAREAVAKKVDYVIAVGGDGTVNEIARELVNTDVIFGIIPLGSGNGLARDLHIPLTKSKAIDIIKEGNVRKIDYGIANDKMFFCTCGVGFDAIVSEKALSQKRRGKMMYAQNIMTTLFNFSPEKYKIKTPDGTVYEDKAYVITCANASQYGNDAFIAPHADIQDGKMNIVILKPLSPIKITQVAVQMFTKNLGNNSKQIEFLASEAVVEREQDGFMHLDGDAFLTDKNIHVRIVHQGLNVLVPKELPAKKIKRQEFLSSITRWV